MLALIFVTLFFFVPQISMASDIRSSVTAPSITTIIILDTTLVHKLYLDGDFEEAIQLLESALSRKTPYCHQDSILIFKHLGVMYAANEGTREKGKYFMMKLLEVEPTAKIMDMYASDMIYMIYKNIQEEYEVTRFKYKHANSLGEKGNQKNHSNGRWKTLGWSTATLLGVGVLAAATYYSLEPTVVKKNRRVVN